MTTINEEMAWKEIQDKLDIIIELLQAELKATREHAEIIATG